MNGERGKAIHRDDFQDGYSFVYLPRTFHMKYQHIIIPLYIKASYQDLEEYLKGIKLGPTVQHLHIMGCPLPQGSLHQGC